MSTAPIIDPIEFTLGFCDGILCRMDDEWAWKEMRDRMKNSTFGMTSQRRIPTDYNRGFARGYKEATRFANDPTGPQPNEREAYNMECRRKLKLDMIQRLREARDKVSQ